MMCDDCEGTEYIKIGSLEHRALQRQRNKSRSDAMEKMALVATPPGPRIGKQQE